MAEKIQQLIFDKGITNVPSDATCSDNALEEAVGIIYENGEHKVIQKPVVQASVPTEASATILYVHNLYGKRYICIWRAGREGTPHLAWAVTSGSALTYMGELGGIDVSNPDDVKISSVGNTLVVVHPGGMRYYLWKQDGYLNLGTLPSPEVDFYLVGDTPLTIGEYQNAVWSSQSCEDIIAATGHIARGAQEKYNNLVTGLYAKNKKSVAIKKQFCEPFFVRCALELYDETYAQITQPVLLFPAISDNSLLSVSNDVATMKTGCCRLYYKNRSDLGEWADIVKNISIFISDGISLYDVSVDQPNSGTEVSTLQNGIFSTSGASVVSEYHEVSGSGYRDLKKRPNDEIEADIMSSSIFYKLCEIGRDGDGVGHDIAQHIQTHTLENLTTLDILEYDDLYSRCKFYPKFIYSYNSRINIANVKRGFFEGFDYFMPFDNETASEYRFYVTITTDTGNSVTVLHEKVSTQKQGIYFYYPDSRATKVMIFKKINGVFTCILNQNLKEHPGLNGAYYFKGYPLATYTESAVTGSEPEVTPESSAVEVLDNFLITSEVNDPYVFRAQGYNKVGVGEIYGIATTTMALSNDSFGRNDLLIFSELGVWGMSVDETGLYRSSHPFSRDVCNNPKSITPVDGAVFFSSEKGLMMATDKSVVCVSEQLNGHESNFTGEVAMGNFHDFLKNCFIAYDYRDSLLWIFNNSRAANTDYCYIYSIKSGTFCKYRMISGVQRVVNDYPDYLLSFPTTYASLVNRPNINNDGETVNGSFVYNTYNAYMISRPLKLENAFAVKAIKEIRNIGDKANSIKCTLYGSNNFDNWNQLDSLGGAPYIYYRVRLDFTNVRAVDRYAGTVVVTEERRTDKLR